MTYATEEQKKLARSLGYEVEQSVVFGNRFWLGRRLVWPIKEGWQTADYMKTLFGQGSKNHKRFKHLEDALRRPLDDEVKETN